MTAAGALLFGRYAFPPNQLGYCGPADHQALLGYVSTHTADQGLVELERRFEGAFPYLQLIARANDIADPFDEQVVDAYWIGNQCLERVEARTFHDSLQERFGARMQPSQWKWLAGKMALNARPHHNFHVFDIYTRAGLMTDERATVAVETMDSCRVSWGKVVGIEADHLIVERQPLELCGGKLALGPARPARVTRQLDGQALGVGTASLGDEVSIHWSWACDRLGPQALERLRLHTKRYLTMANQTL